MLKREDFGKQINNQSIGGKTPFYAFVEDYEAKNKIRIVTVFESDFEGFELWKNPNGIPYIKKK
mgnify:CR=1 FL=1